MFETILDSNKYYNII